MTTDRRPPIDEAFAAQFLLQVSDRLPSTELERWRAAAPSIRSDAAQIAKENARFAEFFHRNGAPEVTATLCALDDIWAEELRKPGYGVHFERPTTLAKGDDACRFQFTKIDPPE